MRVAQKIEDRMWAVKKDQGGQPNKFQKITHMGQTNRFASKGTDPSPTRVVTLAERVLSFDRINPIGVSRILNYKQKETVGSVIGVTRNTARAIVASKKSYEYYCVLMTQRTKRTKQTKKRRT